MVEGFTLVLGGGGSTGIASMCGALRAFQEVTGRDPSAADLLIGTSAGAVLGAELRLGRSLDEVMRQVDPGSDESCSVVPAWRSVPDLARRVVGSTWIAARTTMPIPVPAPAPPRCVQRLFPSGLLQTDHDEPWYLRYPVEWPDDPLWITATDVDLRRRVVLGTRGAPIATLQQALRASCAVPGVYPPVRVGSRRLVDGGFPSVNNIDLAVSAPSRVVVVLAPMGFDPLDPPGRLLRALRGPINAQIASEARRVRLAGKRILFLRPSGAELAHHGFNVLSNSENDLITAAAHEATLTRLRDPRLRAVLTQLTSPTMRSR
jgi:NTE family protein